MKLVWTKSNLPLSVVIRAVTGEPCSHFAFVFETAAKGLMFQSNFLGTHPKFWANAQKHMEIVHEINIPLPIEIEDAIWDAIVEKYDSKPYDLGGMVYLGWRILLLRLFNRPLPDKNPWANDDSFFCDEVYDVFNSVEGFIQLPVGNGMDTPEMVWQKLKDWQYGILKENA